MFFVYVRRVVLCYDAQAVRLSVCPSVRPLTNSCKHNSSCSFQWMVLKPSRIVTHGTWLCVKDLFIRLFLSYGPFQIFIYIYQICLVFLIGGLHFLRVYNVPVGGALVTAYVTSVFYRLLHSMLPNSKPFIFKQMRNKYLDQIRVRGL